MGNGQEFVGMATPNKEKTDIWLTRPQRDRADVLAELYARNRPEVLREAIDIGMDEMEQRIARHLQFENALLVNKKLKRRPELILEAIAKLEDAGGDPEAIALLKAAIAGG